MSKKQRSAFNLGSRYSYTPEEIAEDPAISSMIKAFFKQNSAYSLMGVTFEEVIRRVTEESRIIELGQEGGTLIVIMSQENREAALSMDTPPTVQLQHTIARAGNVEVNICPTHKPLLDHANIWHKLKAEQAAQQSALRIQQESEIQESQSKLTATEEANAKTEAARVKVEQEAAPKAEEEVRVAEKQAQDEATQRAAEEVARAQAQEEVVQRAAEEARLKAENETKATAEAARAQAEQEAIQRAAEEARLSAEEPDYSDIPELVSNPVSNLVTMLAPPPPANVHISDEAMGALGQSLHTEDGNTSKSSFCTML